MSKKLSMRESCTKVSVAVVYDSGSRGYSALSGRTRMLAEGIARGAGAVEGTAVTLIPVADRASQWETLDAASPGPQGYKVDRTVTTRQRKGKLLPFFGHVKRFGKPPCGKPTKYLIPDDDGKPQSAQPTTALRL